MLLIIIGGIGFIVIMEIPQLLKRQKKRPHITIQTKVALSVTLILIVLGMTVFLLTEKDNTMTGFSVKEKALGSLFQSVTARTAGFNTIDIGRLATPTLLILVFLMFSPTYHSNDTADARAHSHCNGSHGPGRTSSAQIQTPQTATRSQNRAFAYEFQGKQIQPFTSTRAKCPVIPH